MTKKSLVLISFASLLLSPKGFGFGRKSMHVFELRGVTESQVAKGEGKASVMVRGKAAELMFRMMQEQQQPQSDTEALKWMNSKDGAHWIVQGKQVSCSKISNLKKKQDDYACAFGVDQSGNISLVGEAFNPATFNLAHTETGSKLFKKKIKARGLASVAPTATYSKGLAFLVYDEPGKQRSSENAMIVFRGDSAKEIMALLETTPDAKEANWGPGKGRQGKEIACVGATGKEPERCALVVTFRDGSITRTGNPLFR